MKDKESATVELCDAEAVNEVMKRKSIIYRTTELDVKPFKPLLPGDVSITQAGVKASIDHPKDFTEHLLPKYIDDCDDPGLAAKTKEGSRVVNGRDWCDGNTHKNKQTDKMRI